MEEEAAASAAAAAAAKERPAEAKAETEGTEEDCASTRTSQCKSACDG